ncbi:hypothetical protein ZWY2020_049726 [Hordeum vulgare]|nr:hypothetical protein ZWY2020_049726 [Hordeum vulgare]
MPPFHDCRDGGLLVLDPGAEALFGRVRHRKRVRVTAVHPRVFAAAEEVLRAAPAAKRQRLREVSTLDALPDGCLFEVLRRVQAPAGASAPPAARSPLHPRSRSSGPSRRRTSTRSSLTRMRTRMRPGRGSLRRPGARGPRGRGRHGRR